MRMTLHRLSLPLAHEFAISRATIATQPTLIVELEHDGLHGYGEVTENPYYGHTFASMTASLDKVSDRLDDYANESPSTLWPRMSRLIGGDTFALSALDMAAHDLRGRIQNIPTWQDWGLNWNTVPESSYTIGIDSIDTMVAKLNEQPNWNTYKIKLGTPQDIDIVSALRQHSDAVFRVDANCGWTADETIVNSKSLAELGVEFIEQPLPISAALEDKARVFSESALPIIADEDCQIQADIHRCSGLFHGVNVKICKCGGLSPALTMLREAHDLGMTTMVGCMIESSIGISGAAQLLPLLDYADLDGAVLLKDDPAQGVTVINGEVILAQQPGCGGELIRNRLDEFRI
jgi:L-alanine-DL-glutamate epimerase-like enolase superfamily enzyme